MSGTHGMGRRGRRMRFGGVALLVCVMAVGGCGYRLRGTVIEATTSAVLVVDQDDPRLTEPGLPGAVVSLTLDPGHLNAKNLGAHATDMNGRFDVPIGQGAGFLEYQLELLCWLSGYQSAQQRLALPGGTKQLLILMAPGQDSYRPGPDILDESLRIEKQLR